MRPARADISNLSRQLRGEDITKISNGKEERKAYKQQKTHVQQLRGPAATNTRESERERLPEEIETRLVMLVLHGTRVGGIEQEAAHGHVFLGHSVLLVSWTGPGDEPPREPGLHHRERGQRRV